MMMMCIVRQTNGTRTKTGGAAATAKAERSHTRQYIENGSERQLQQ